MRTIMMIVPALLFAACASTSSQKAVSLSQKGQEVEWVKRIPSSSCEVVGQVIGENEFGSVEVARTDARNKAGEFSATHLLVKDEVVNGKSWKIYGVAYRCP